MTCFFVIQYLRQFKKSRLNFKQFGIYLIVAKCFYNYTFLYGRDYKLYCIKFDKWPDIDVLFKEDFWVES